MLELPVAIYTERSSGESVNTESEFVFLYVLSGNLHVLSDAETLKLSREDILLLPSGISFSLQKSNDCHMIQACFSASFIKQQTDSHIFFQCNSILEPKKDYHTLKMLLKKLTSLYQESASANHYLIMGNLYLFLEELTKHFSFHPSMLSSLSDSHTPDSHASISRYQMRKEHIINYIEENYTKPITLQNLADTLFLSPEYTSVFFKKAFSMTFHQYLNQKRIMSAAKYIVQNSDPLVDVASLFGFHNFHTFYKNFRKILGQSPNQYRNQFSSDFLSENSTSICDNSEFLNSDMPALSQTFSLSEASYSCSLKDDLSCDFIMNIGSARNLLSRQFQEELLLAKDRFQFRYVRIEDIVSNSLIPKVMPDYEYFFHNVYQILQFLHTNDFVPFIELTRTSYANHNLTDDISSAFHIQNRYLNILNALLIYCTDHFPDEWVEQWKFELWMAPHISLEKYCADFQTVSELIHRYLPQAKIGGPGFHKALSNYDFHDFLNRIKSREISLDFISIYLHLVVKPEGSQKNNDSFMISTDSEYLLKECKSIHTLIQQHLPDFPLYVTEFTSVPDIRIPFIYSCYHATFLLKNLPELFQYCNCIGYWLLMDSQDVQPCLSIEASSAPWGQGLITKNGYYTPSYYVLKELLSYRTMIQYFDNHYILLHIDDFHYKIIAYYHSHISPEYCNHSLVHLQFDKLTDIYCDKEPLPVELQLSGLSEGIYQITRLQIDAQHNSPIDKLISEYQSGNVSSSKFLALSYSQFHPSDPKHKETYAPEAFTYYIHLDSEECLYLKEMLSPNSLFIWDIQRKYELNT